MSLESKKVALVTGSARGIGLATAARFLEDGWQVAMLDILGDTLRSAVDALGRADATLALQADVSDASAVQAAVALTQRRFGRIDALVNNAGIAVFKPMLDVTLEEWQRVSPRMSSIATCQPSSRKRAAVARPMPRAEPVTRATLFDSDDMPAFLPS